MRTIAEIECGKSYCRHHCPIHSSKGTPPLPDEPLQWAEAEEVPAREAWCSKGALDAFASALATIAALLKPKWRRVATHRAHQDRCLARANAKRPA